MSHPTANVRVSVRLSTSPSVKGAGEGGPLPIVKGADLKLLEGRPLAGTVTSAGYVAALELAAPVDLVEGPDEYTWVYTLLSGAAYTVIP